METNTVTNENVADTNTQELVDNNASLKEKCVVFGPFKVEGPCGKKSLSDSEIRIGGHAVFNDNVSGGDLSWFPSKFTVNGIEKSTRISGTYKTRIDRALQQFGVKIGGLVLIPKEHLKELGVLLDKAESDFNEASMIIGDNYDQIIAQHKKANPDIADLIDEHALSCSEYMGRFVFRKPRPLSMMPYFAEDEVEFEMDARDALFEEVAKDGLAMYKKSFTEGDRVSQKIRSPFKKAISKLISLAFLDEGIMRVVDTIEAELDKLPKHGYIEGKDFDGLAKWALIMGNKDALMTHANGGDIAIEEDEALQPEGDDEEISDSFDESLETFETIDEEQSTEITNLVENVDDEAEVIETLDDSTFGENFLEDDESVEEDEAIDLDDHVEEMESIGFDSWD